MNAAELAFEAGVQTWVDRFESNASEIIHLVDEDGDVDTALCGLDVSGHAWMSEGTYCVVCDDIDEWQEQQEALS